MSSGRWGVEAEKRLGRGLCPRQWVGIMQVGFISTRRVCCFLEVSE
jgi:hypothetical protein